MAFGGIFPPGHVPSPLEQMLTEISYHRTREIAQYSREGKFVTLILCSVIE